MVDCKTCKGRFRADQTDEIPCPQKPSKWFRECARRKDRAARVQPDVSNLRRPGAGRSAIAYLRPETAQAIFAQFKNVLETSRQKVPFGIAPDRQGVSQRGHAAQLHLPLARVRADGTGVFHQAGRGHRSHPRFGGHGAGPPGHPGEPQPNWGWQAWHQYWVEERVRFYEGIGLSARHAGLSSADAGGTGALRPRLRGHPVQVPVQQAR